MVARHTISLISDRIDALAARFDISGWSAQP
jgi:hypothetical protein